ncbi:MAG: hypothetical protein CO108_19080 [Deltaproteobacteria bacterium CG_4_9_14_3_um_filter_63_12]|nr:MAG: hypothetical protein CO108_19080 [Deltaproteobacteria bacterium CG_4_9_14_3_um_filter_63_12]
MPTEPAKSPRQRDPHTPVARVSALDCVLEIPGEGSLRVDSLGRWGSARIDGQLYRRTLDGRVVGYVGKHVPPVDVPDPARLHARVRAQAREFVTKFENPDEALLLSGSHGERAALLATLRRVEDWPAEAFAAEHEVFRAAYDEEVEILPPDRYLDLVVLPATGCPNAGCTFCAFYQGKRFAVKSAAEFDAHLEKVVSLFGPSLGLRRGLFLGGASALSLSQKRILGVLEQCRARLGSGLTDQSAAFWDPDHSPKRTLDDFNALFDAGLKVAYVGLETGLASLREEVGKSGDTELLAAQLRALTASRMRLGLIVLSGLGGLERSAAHIEATTKFVSGLGLRADDVVFASPLRDSMPYEALLAADAALRKALKAVVAAHVVPYAMEVFRYYV